MLTSHRRLQERQGQSGTPRHEYLQQLVNEYARTPQLLRKEEIVANLANFAYDPINFPILHRLNVVGMFVDIMRDWRNTEQRHQSAPSDSTNRSSAENRPWTGSASRSSHDADRFALSRQLQLEFAIGGICNCIPDPILQTAFISSGGAQEVIALVESITPDRFVGDMGDWATAQTDRSSKNRYSEFSTALSALTTAYFLLDSPAFMEITSEAFVGHVASLCEHSNIQIANVAKVFVARYNELLESFSADDHE